MAMLGLQAAIGVLNDVVDAPRDAGLKPGKPIPAGLVPRDVALIMAGGAAAAGLALSALSGPGTLVVAAVVLAIGALYDLRLKGTAWSWLPFAAGIPLLPVFAWVGVTGTLPERLMVFLPAAFLAGAALAIANGLADVERDRGGGVTSIAAHLGRARAWRLHLALHGIVLVLALASLWVEGWAPLLATAAAAVPGLLIGTGVLLAGSADPARRERGWEVEAIGIAVLAGTWFSFGMVD